MNIKKYIDFIRESSSMSKYPSFDEMKDYLQPISDLLVRNKITIRYEPAYHDRENLITGFSNGKIIVGYICKILSENNISKLNIEETVKEINHISENIKLDYPNLDIYFHNRSHHQMFCLFLMDPTLTDIDRIKNYNIIKI